MFKIDGSWMFGFKYRDFLLFAAFTTVAVFLACRFIIALIHPNLVVWAP